MLNLYSFIYGSVSELGEEGGGGWWAWGLVRFFTFNDGPANKLCRFSRTVRNYFYHLKYTLNCTVYFLFLSMRSSN